MAELLLYKKVAALDKEKHRGLSIRKIDNLGFAAHAQSMLVTGGEYGEACKEYPIVFVRTPDGMASVVLLGIRQNENLFLDSGGKWNARYIPAYVRRYPFILSDADVEGRQVLCMDEEFTGLNRNGEGELLFDAQGTLNAGVNNLVPFLQEFQADLLRTRTFLDRLQQLELLKQNNAKITLASGEEFLLDGIWVVDEAGLNALDDAVILQLTKSGDMSRIYAHLISLSNLSNFIRLAEQQKTAG